MQNFPFTSNYLNLFSSLPSLHRRKKSYELNPPENCYHVIYLGNVLVTGLGNHESSVEKPLAIIWKNHLTGKTTSSKKKQQIRMLLSVTNSGLKLTNDSGITEYWSHRITFCCSPTPYPLIFCWIYKHEGKRMKPDLRCHAVLCKKMTDSSALVRILRHNLCIALQEYKREKLAAERARKNSLPSFPRRKMLLQTGSANFRSPVTHSRSFPRLGSIDETAEEETSSDELNQKSLTNHLTLMEEDMDLFDDQSVNLDFRSTPQLSGDSSSQHSISSTSSICGFMDEEELVANDDHSNDESNSQLLLIRAPEENNNLNNVISSVSRLDLA